MKTYQGAVFCDIDGTLVEESEFIFQPTEKVIEALHRVKEKGYLIGVATGRARCYIPDLRIDFDCYVSCNGAAAEVDGEALFSDTIAGAELEELLAFMEEREIGCCLENSRMCHYNKAAERDLKTILEVFRLDKSVFHPLSSVEEAVANKIMVSFDSMEKYQALVQAFGERYRIPLHRNGMSADLGKRSISKATGIQAVLKRLEIPMDYTYAFGDYDNDIQMLETVAHGVAMTPHSEKLKEIAEFVTKSVKEDGVYWGLKHYGLI